MNEVSIWLSLAKNIKNQCERYRQASLVLGLLDLLERRYPNLEPFCNSRACEDYLKQIVKLVEDIKGYIERSPNIAIVEIKAAELLEATENLADLKSLESV